MTGAIGVTGATGYLGTRVMNRLRETGRNATAIPGRRDGFDLTNRSQVGAFVAGHRLETIIHCAAMVPKSAADYRDDDAGAASLAMTENLVAAGPAHIVFASSMTVYADDADMPAHEDDVRDDRTGYAGFKRRAEQALQNASPVKATVLRLPGLFGPPRKSGLLYNAARSFARGTQPALADPAPLWAAMHVDDAADLMVRAAVRSPQASIIVNAGYDEEMSVSKTVSQLASCFGVTVAAGNAPAFRMDLTRLKDVLGLPVKTLADRLSELAVQARSESEKIGA